MLWNINKKKYLNNEWWLEGSRQKCIDERMLMAEDRKATPHSHSFSSLRLIRHFHQHPWAELAWESPRSHGEGSCCVLIALFLWIRERAWDLMALRDLNYAKLAEVNGLWNNSYRATLDTACVESFESLQSFHPSWWHFDQQNFPCNRQFRLCISQKNYHPYRVSHRTPASTDDTWHVLAPSPWSASQSDDYFPVAPFARNPLLLSPMDLVRLCND